MNPADDVASVFRALPGFEVIAFDGPDAATFLQAQLASDVASLAVGEWQWSSWLSAQGRVLFLLLLLRSGPAGFLALVAHGRGDELVQRLGRYVLRAKAGIARAPLQAVGRVAGALVGGARVQAGGAATPVGASWDLDLGGARARRLRLGPEPGPVAGDVDWQLADIDDGVPWIHPAVADRETPQALGLERLGAYSVHKGCYPGQEIVARTHFLGRSKRNLLRFRAGSSGVPAPGDALNASDGTAAATVVAAIRLGHEVSGLAVVRDPSRASMATPDGAPVVLTELP